MAQILTHLRNVSVSAHHATTTTQQFWEDCGVVSMGRNFEAQFLGLEVDAVEAGTLSISKLENRSLDDSILEHLGEKARTSVLHFAEFLSQNRGSSEFFVGYFSGADGEHWAVHADWRAGSGGWHLSAYPVTRPYEWYAGFQVVSCK